MIDADLMDDYKVFIPIKDILCNTDSKIEELIDEDENFTDIQVRNSLFKQFIEIKDKRIKFYVRPSWLKSGLTDGYSYLIEGKKIKLMFFKLRHWNSPYGVQAELI